MKSIDSFQKKISYNPFPSLTNPIEWIAVV